jgi:hypothetical protein
MSTRTEGERRGAPDCITIRAPQWLTAELVCSRTRQSSGAPNSGEFGYKSGATNYYFPSTSNWAAFRISPVASF